MFLSRACLSWALAMAKTSTPGCIYYFASYQSLPAAARYRTTVYRVQNSFPKIDPGGHTPSSRLPPLRNGRVVVCVCVCFKAKALLPRNCNPLAPVGTESNIAHFFRSESPCWTLFIGERKPEPVFVYANDSRSSCFFPVLV